jgi:hypothetical protein
MLLHFHSEGQEEHVLLHFHGEGQKNAALFLFSEQSQLKKPFSPPLGNFLYGKSDAAFFCFSRAHQHPFCLCLFLDLTVHKNNPP